MAITTLDGALAGALAPIPFYKFLTGGGAGKPLSLWAGTGFPGAGAFDTTLNGVTLDKNTAGAIPWDDAPSGYLTYMNLLEVLHSFNGAVMLCDRLWHNGGITITSTAAQAIVSPAWPARDVDGSANGRGVMIGVELETALGAATPTITISYTNSDGVAGRTATNADAIASGQPLGTFLRMRLQAGDKGVRSVQSVQLSASGVSGTIHLVAYRILAMVSQVNNIGEARDALTGGFPRIRDGACLQFINIISSAGAVNLSGLLGLTQG